MGPRLLLLLLSGFKEIYVQYYVADTYRANVYNMGHCLMLLLLKWLYIDLGPVLRNIFLQSIGFG